MRFYSSAGMIISFIRKSVGTQYIVWHSGHLCGNQNVSLSVVYSFTELKIGWEIQHNSTVLLAGPEIVCYNQIYN